MVKTNMSSNGPSLGPDPNSDSKTKLPLRNSRERVWPRETQQRKGSGHARLIPALIYGTTTLFDTALWSSTCNHCALPIREATLL